MMHITETTFNKVFPHATRGIYQILEKNIEKAGCLTKPQQAMFLAQCGHESAGFAIFIENLNYSRFALLNVFRKYFNEETAKQYARNQQMIANKVYANRMGNGDEASGDGWRYRGRGIIQLTGKNNYTAFQNWLGYEVPPEAISKDLDLAVKVGVWYWLSNELANINSVEKVTRRINGGLNGLPDRVNLYRKLMV
ncbi:glycoside hydrolase family 19 protein [Pasteurella sp. PK-2025]|uniref:glycoside hydrolase family 19 protein n=1 Tax=Pasteurella sp. PK-2025 TaxID=3413133 RepID=UPI003C7673CA